MALSGGTLPDRGCQGTPTWDNTKEDDTFEVLGFTNSHILVVHDLSLWLCAAEQKYITYTLCYYWWTLPRSAK